MARPFQRSNQSESNSSAASPPPSQSQSQSQSQSSRSNRTHSLNSPTNSVSSKPHTTSTLNSLCTSLAHMCKSFRRTDAIDPTATPRSSRTSRLSKRSSSQSQDSPTPPVSSSTSSAEPSSSRSRSNTSSAGSSNRDSSKASISSKTSLSTIRESLPENPHIYDFSEISAATNNFLANRFSSSAVWRCSLHGKDAIIFQRRLRRSMEASRLRQRLSLICRSHHASLVNLLGASISGDHIYLVYEYVNGASLGDCLRNQKNPNFTVLSNWMSRMQGALDIAEGLDYIHNSIGLNQNFVHNHIKSTGVIITGQPSLHATICHFGTAELCGEIPEYHHHQHQHQEGNWEITEISETSPPSSPRLKRVDTRGMRFEGTIGYMSPEFQATGIGTQKSDVFAFGVVLLELLSGEEPLRYMLDGERGEYRRVSLIETATEAMEEEEDTDTGTGKGEEEGEGVGRSREGTGRLRRWVDRRLKDSFPVEVAEKMTRIALNCVDVDPDRRPNMRDVAGKISKLYLKSERWSKTMVLPPDFTISLAPR